MFPLAIAEVVTREYDEYRRRECHLAGEEASGSHAKSMSFLFSNETYARKERERRHVYKGGFSG